ncbi:hypothetical protein LTR95_001214 [Oleoguttula sp. CCFEE 5521]
MPLNQTGFDHALTPVNRLVEAAKRNRHNYSPLPSNHSMRVMVLRPGRNEDPIVFSLDIVHDRKHVEEYHALSYCWGDAADTVEVLCSGKPFFITRTLYGALWWLRSEDSARRLWADAVCINQDDITERNVQVSMFRQIYAGARRVHIWLGPRDADTSNAMAFIDHIATKCCTAMYGEEGRSQWVARLQQEDEPSRVFSQILLTTLPDVSSSSWQTLAGRYDRPWFTRVWVVQEVQACNDVWVTSGDITLEWEFVALVASWVRYATDALIYYGTSSETQRGLRAATTMRQGLVTRWEIPFLLALDRNRERSCTDNRDRVFAMLQHPIRPVLELNDQVATLSHKTLGNDLPPSLQDQVNETHLGIRADYNMTTLEVYRDVALRSIQRTSLDDLEFPSWILRWDLATVGGEPYFQPWLYNACAGRRPILSCPSASTLVLRGIRIDSVLRRKSTLPVGGKSMRDFALGPDWLLSLSRIITRDTWASDHIHSSTWKRATEELDSHFADFAAYMLDIVGDNITDSFIPLLERWCDICDGPVAPSEEIGTEAPWTYGCEDCSDGEFDLCLPCYKSGKRCNGSFHKLQQKPIMGLRYIHNDMTLNRLRASASTGNAERYKRRVRNNCTYTFFFVTEAGHVGIGPDYVCPGDVVAVLFGGRVPFLLRKRAEHYRIVGPCYVFDMMDGKAVEDCEEGRLVEEEFELQ